MERRKRFTSIGQLCCLEINLVKICGGFMFAQQHHWYLTIGYKMLVSIFTIYLAAKSFAVYDGIRVESKSAQKNINFFLTFHQLAAAFAYINSNISSIRYEKLVSVVLNKRFDARYFSNSAYGSSKPNKVHEPRLMASRETDSARHSVGAQLETLDQRDKSDGSSFFMFMQNKLQIRDYLARLNLDFRETGMSCLDHHSRVRLARCLIVFHLILSAFSATLQVDSEQNYSKSSSTSVQPAIALNDSSTVFVPDKVLDDGRSVGNSSLSIGIMKIKRPINTFHLYFEYSKRIANQLLGQLSKLARISPVLLLELVSVSLVHFQIYGQLMVILLITSSLADLLWRVRQQELTRNPYHDEQRPPNTDRPPKQVGGHRNVLNTTDLLIQVRDVLVALRSAARLDYLFIQVLDMSGQMHIFSLFVAFIAGNQYRRVGLLLIHSCALFLATLLTRLGYVWLHAEVRKIGSIFEQRFIARALETHNLDAIHWRSHSAESNSTKFTTFSNLSLPATNSRSAGSASSDKSASIVSENNAGRQDASSDLSKQKACVQDKTNYRLAREIEQIWPTDWFTPDIESYVSQIAFVITFVTTLQQLVEASAKLQLQSQRNGGAPQITVNRTN